MKNVFGNIRISGLQEILLMVILLLGGCVVRQNDFSDGGVKGSEPVGDEKNLETVIVGQKELSVEVADDSDEITRGLGYRDKIGSDGMLFVMPRPAMYTFWMKGMRIGLDMVWIDCEIEEQENRETDKQHECEVVDITEKVPAPEDPEDVANLEIYQPREPVTYVLEVDYGKTEEWGVEVGDAVVLN